MEETDSNQPLNAAPNNNRHRYLSILVVILMILIIGVTGWYFVGRSNTTSQDSSNTPTNIPEIATSDDLSSAEQFLSDTQIDEQLDTSEIDSALSN